MLQTVRACIAEASDNAHAAESQAANAPTTTIRKHYEALASNWRKLAENFELLKTSERLFAEKEEQGRQFPVIASDSGHQSMSQRPVEPYRQFAIDCIKMASRTKIVEDKKLLEQMAETWLRLAEQRARKGPRVARDRS
jgi:hypothetical protein